LDLLKELGFNVSIEPLSLPIAKDDEVWADMFLSKQGLGADETKIGLVPGGGASWGPDAVYKRWPAQKYAELADKLIENLKTPIILLGDQKERELCEQIAGLMKHKVVLACGRTNVGQCAALFKQCALAVVNDGGPLHIAVASGTKTVSIFGPVNENVYGPYPGDRHAVVTSDIACRPCYHQFRRANCEHLSCLHNIQVDSVYQKVSQLLNNTPKFSFS
jgi:ADP-heptose:LPS heptosyltransferase